MNRPMTFGRRRVTVAALVAVGLAVVAYAISDTDDEVGGPAARTAAAQPSVQADPTMRLAGLRWGDYGGIALPSSQADGPRVVRGGLVSGFARTPSGALLAAVHIVVRATAKWGPEVFEPTIERQVIGADREALLESCREFYEQEHISSHIPFGRPLGRAYAVLEGFRWQTYSPELASVDVVSAGPGDQGVTVRASTRIQLQWQSGDWRVLAPVGGDWGRSAAPVTSLAGYTRFLARW